MTAENTSAPATPGPGRASRIAALPCGRRTKYLVLIFWVIVIGLTGSLAGKLMGAEKNDASAYLPASAESTQPSPAEISPQEAAAVTTASR